MPHIVRSIVNDVDMRKTDHADDKKAENHRQKTLKNNARLCGDEKRQTGSVRFLQECLRKLPSNFSLLGITWPVSVAGPHPCW